MCRTFSRNPGDREGIVAARSVEDWVICRASFGDMALGAPARVSVDSFGAHADDSRIWVR